MPLANSNRIFRYLVAFAIVPFAVVSGWLVAPGRARADEIPNNLRVVLASTQPLESPLRGGRLPLLVLPISNQLANVGDEQASRLLRQLDERGIGYSVDWNHQEFHASLQEG